jgi:23S rRNA U2552 (ribose-2'-O)-methylase RlmE/FtsJ
MSIKEIFNSLDLSCDKLEHYFPLYERHFSKFIGKSPKILEIGVQYGGSSELWRKYFGEGTTIIGVDINPLAIETDYLTIVTGDQGDEIFWTKFLEKYNNFDITKQLIDVINSLHTEFYIRIGLEPFNGPKIDKSLLEIYELIQGIYFYDSIVVIDKGPKFKFNRMVS